MYTLFVGVKRLKNNYFKQQQIGRKATAAWTPFIAHQLTLREKCPYSEFFWSVFSRICTEYGPEKL